MWKIEKQKVIISYEKIIKIIKTHINSTKQDVYIKSEKVKEKYFLGPKIKKIKKSKNHQISLKKKIVVK